MSLYLLRQKLGIPVKEIAQKMGIHPSYYSHLENGRRKFNEDLILRLAAALGVSQELIEQEVQNIESKRLEAPLWISSIKVHGINSLKAFENFIVLNRSNISTADLKQLYASFIEQNIAMSILSEFESNPEFTRTFNYRFSKFLETL